MKIDEELPPRQPAKAKLPTEYLLVSDKNSKVLLSTTNWVEVKKTAGLIRRGGGEVTVFKSTKG